MDMYSHKTGLETGNFGFDRRIILSMKQKTGVLIGVFVFACSKICGCFLFFFVMLLIYTKQFLNKRFEEKTLISHHIKKPTTSIKENLNLFIPFW